MDIRGDLMSEIQHSEIIYEEGWRDAAPPAGEEPPVDEAVLAPGTEAEDAVRSRPLLVIIRLVLCLLAALVLFLLKAMDSEGYDRFMAFYREELQKPVVSQELFSNADLSRLFSADTIMIRTTPDEAARSED